MFVVRFKNIHDKLSYTAHKLPIVRGLEHMLSCLSIAVIDLVFDDGDFACNADSFKNCQSNIGTVFGSVPSTWK
jgi:hypothetical protein